MMMRNAASWHTFSGEKIQQIDKGRARNSGVRSQRTGNAAAAHAAWLIARRRQGTRASGRAAGKWRLPVDRKMRESRRKGGLKTDRACERVYTEGALLQVLQ